MIQSADIHDVESPNAALRAGLQPAYLFFWGHTANRTSVGKHVLSQWWPAPFVIDGQQADVDTATTTTPISDEEGIAEGESGPEVPEPTSTELDETSPDVAPDVSPPENATEPIPEAANDNGIGIEALPANEPIEKSPAVNE